jgi:CRISPR-associated autoregulator DevR family
MLREQEQGQETEIGNIKNPLTHVVGCYVISADASFLNGGGKGDSPQGFDNYTIIKSFMDGRQPGGGPIYSVPYVSGQAVRYWVRTTIIKMTGWNPSLKRALGLNPKGNPEKSGTARNPIDFAEDDLFGYMDTMSKDMKAILKLNEKIQNGEFILPQNAEITAKEIAKTVLETNTKLDIDVDTATTDDDNDDDEDGEDDNNGDEAKASAINKTSATAATAATTTTKSKETKDSEAGDTQRGFFRTSPVSMSPIIGLRNSAWEGIDNAYVYTADGSIPFQTQFHSCGMVGIFTVAFSRIGVFQEAGDMSDLDPDMRDANLANGKLVEDLEHRPEFYKAEANQTIQAVADYIEGEKNKKKKGKGSKSKETKQYTIPVQKFGRRFNMAELERVQYERSTAYLRAIAKLQGGARQSVFCTDVSPKCLVLAGTSNGISIFNNIFEEYTLEGARGKNVRLKINTLQDIIIDHADDIVTPVVIGVLSDYLENDPDVKQLDEQVINGVRIIVTTPIQAVEMMCNLLPGADKYGRKLPASTTTNGTS